jgi:hypothetical protein
MIWRLILAFSLWALGLLMLEFWVFMIRRLVLARSSVRMSNCESVRQQLRVLFQVLRSPFGDSALVAESVCFDV